MIKSIATAFLLLSFSIVAKAHEAPTFVVSCNDCTAQDLRHWFIDTIVRKSNDNPEVEHQKIWNRNRVLVYRHSTSEFDAFKLTASPTVLLKGISESTFKVTLDSASKAEEKLARSLLANQELIDHKLEAVAQTLSRTFDSAHAFNTWLNNKHAALISPLASSPAGFRYYGDSCLDHPQYLAIKTLHSTDIAKLLQKRATKVFETHDNPSQSGSTSFQNEHRFIKGTEGDLTLHLVKRAFDHQRPIYLRFEEKTTEETTATARFSLALEGSQLVVESKPHLSELGDVSITMLQSYGGEVSQCAVVAMNEYRKPTMVKQTSMSPKLKSNVNEDDQYLCSYIYGDSDERIILGSTCSIVNDDNLISDTHFKPAG